MTNNMPEKIWAGYLGGGRIWGNHTEETHPDNTPYLKESTITPVIEGLRDALRDIRTAARNDEGDPGQDVIDIIDGIAGRAIAEANKLLGE